MCGINEMSMCACESACSISWASESGSETGNKIIHTKEKTTLRRNWTGNWKRALTHSLAYTLLCGTRCQLHSLTHTSLLYTRKPVALLQYPAFCQTLVFVWLRFGALRSVSSVCVCLFFYVCANRELSTRSIVKSVQFVLSSRCGNLPYKERQFRCCWLNSIRNSGDES